jgi:hypothetical protein
MTDGLAITWRKKDSRSPKLMAFRSDLRGLEENKCLDNQLEYNLSSWMV